jgi:hypothetical protein
MTILDAQKFFILPQKKKKVVDRCQQRTKLT